MATKKQAKRAAPKKARGKAAKAAKKVATRIGRKYGIRSIYSNKMMGMNDNGTTKYRHTYCLKF